MEGRAFLHERNTEEGELLFCSGDVFFAPWALVSPSPSIPWLVSLRSSSLAARKVGSGRKREGGREGGKEGERRVMLLRHE